MYVPLAGAAQHDLCIKLSDNRLHCSLNTRDGDVLKAKTK